MLKIDGSVRTGAVLEPFGYVEARGPLGRGVMRLTRRLRAANAGKYLTADLADGGRHLDIGCGDGYFLERSPARVRYGLDAKSGDSLERGIGFPDDYFDVVSMLAVIEHIAEPEPVMAEIHRVLKRSGKFVLTTPRRAAERLMALYARDIDSEHEVYYTAGSLLDLAGDRFTLTDSRTFCLGLNQVFCLSKR